ncbi:RHS repeat-associated core domain-containing protein [Chryseobacterium soli]|uniref:RHS repeat-associated core domain-containing protein n=1 Tax=Chryseobacterium soli TaxID=445961 RepID=UPI00068FA741|nr:RHS repeat-associated core domain-containing protein [Chryseobacterium soli]
MGNARISFGRNSTGALEITDANDYYPYGMNHLKTGNAYFGAGKYQNYKYQGQELQETGFYSFKWRNYMPDVGRFFNIDPLAEKYAYNSTYAFQENKLGMGVELEGLELLKNHTGFFAIHGNAMRVVRAPGSQVSNGRATFTAGDIGLSTSGYNPGGARMSSGSSGLKLNSYKYSGPLVGDAQLQNMKDYPGHSDRQRPTTTKTGAEMWNLKQVAADKTVAADLGVREIAALIKLGANIPDAIKSSENYVNATNDVKLINSQAKTMDRAIQFVDQSGIDMTSQTRNDVVNYVFDGTLPNPGAGLMPNSLIIQNGTQILRDNRLPIQPLDEQLNTNKKVSP